MTKRLSKENRKSEILEAAREVFLEKGFSKTTMEDVIARTTLSKGGVYHYYSNTHEMIIDLCMEGNRYRMDIMSDHLKEFGTDPRRVTDPEMIADLITDKVLDDNPLMDLYVMLLGELKYDPELRELFGTIVAKSKKELTEFFSKNVVAEGIDDSGFFLLTDIINAFILGANNLGAAERFRENREVIREMMKAAIVNIK